MQRGVARLVLAVGCAWGLMTGVAVAQAAGAGTESGQRMPLWNGAAPGAKGDGPGDRPMLTVFLPKANPTGTGVVVVPGGGYQFLSMTNEGSDEAAWLNARGIAAFVLEYRLGPKYHYPVELEDAQRAIRTVRARAAQYGVAPQKIGMWGFSAGGHLAATAGTHFDAGRPGASDAIERVSSRPDFLVLAYPVISMAEPYVHRGSRENLLGDAPDAALVRSLSDETQVTRETPPTFLFATTDDAVVPVMNSVLFYAALVKAGVPAEMHLFQHGNHGSGLAVGNPELELWPELLQRWMEARGLAAK